MARGSVTKTCPHGVTGTANRPACRVKHGSWGYVIPVGKNPATGRPVQKRRRGFTTRDEAEQAMTAELASLDAGTWVDDQGVTVADWLDQWLGIVTAAGLSPKTLANYRGHVRDVWKPTVGDVRLRDLRRHHVETVLRPYAGRAASTIDGYRRTIRAALTEARAHQLVVVNVAEGRMRAIPASDRAQVVVWEPEQTAAFLVLARSHRTLAALFEVAAHTGMRPRRAVRRSTRADAVAA